MSTFFAETPILEPRCSQLFQEQCRRDGTVHPSFYRFEPLELILANAKR
ncbi:MAG: hypothetical protein H6823_26470 [Planctomycetaceae bacterium]|nr:hypothetical protein [Planctomycetales bacterium]MCB9941797.1 hypothetical protein [Planctomycetaceae bacterium]